MAKGEARKSKMANKEVRQIKTVEGEVRKIKMGCGDVREFKMSNGEIRVITPRDLDLVQNLIERCLPLYMNLREIEHTLFFQAGFEPIFTEIVWNQMEAENEEFFRAYHLRLMVKNHILCFNELLEKQANLMHQISHESQIHSMHNNSAYHALHHAGPYMKRENAQQSIDAIATFYNNNGASSMQPCMQAAVNMSSHAGTGSNMQPNMLNGGMVQGLNGETVIKTEGGYAADDSSLMFGADNHLLEPRNGIGEVSVSSYNGLDSSSQALNGTVLQPEMTSFGHLGQISQGFSLSDTAADFPNYVPENFLRLRRLGIDANFLLPHFSGEQEVRSWDTISESFGCEDYGSD